MHARTSVYVVPYAGSASELLGGTCPIIITCASHHLQRPLRSHDLLAVGAGGGQHLVHPLPLARRCRNLVVQQRIEINLVAAINMLAVLLATRGTHPNSVLKEMTRRPGSSSAV